MISVTQMRQFAALARSNPPPSLRACLSSLTLTKILQHRRSAEPMTILNPRRRFAMPARLAFGMRSDDASGVSAAR